MKKKIYLLPLIMLVSLVTVIGLSSCKPPEILDGKDLGVEIKGEMVRWSTIFYDIYNQDGSYQEMLIEKEDEHFEDVKEVTEEVFKDVKLTKLSRKPRHGAERGLLFTYEDGSELYLYGLLNGGIHYFKIDDIWYESNIDGRRLNKIYVSYVVQYGSEDRVFGKR